MRDAKWKEADWKEAKEAEEAKEARRWGRVAQGRAFWLPWLLASSASF
jgi:hypothetical protein